MHQFIIGGGVGRVGQLNPCVETIHYFEGINVTVLERMHQRYISQKWCSQYNWCGTDCIFSKQFLCFRSVSR